MIKIDHNLTMQLWQDPYFWELNPLLTEYKEEAESVLQEALIHSTSLKIKEANFYTDWLKVLENSLVTDRRIVQQLLKYIQDKRKHRQEPVLLSFQGEWVDLRELAG